MTHWHCECRHEKCQLCSLSSPVNPKGMDCPHSEEEIYRTEVDRTPGDLAFSQSNRTDVRWLSHIRPGLVARQTKGGKLICAICSGDIGVDANGKISYVSSSGHLHIEYPPIDHYKPDWRDRKRQVEASPAYVNGDVGKQKTLLLQAYNSEPLRITCKACNLGRPKA